MSAWTCRSINGKAAAKIVPACSPRIPWRWKGLGADSEEKREPVSDVDIAAVDSLKVLDPNRPIREADMPVGRLCELDDPTQAGPGLHDRAYGICGC